MAEKLKYATQLAPRMDLDQLMDQHQTRGMGAQQPGPAPHGAVVKEEDQQPHQRDVGLGRVIDEGVVLHSQCCCRYQFNVPATPALSLVGQAKPVSRSSRVGSHTQLGARSSANFWRLSTLGLPVTRERVSWARHISQSSARGTGRGTVQTFIWAATSSAILGAVTTSGAATK